MPHRITRLPRRHGGCPRREPSDSPAAPGLQFLDGMCAMDDLPDHQGSASPMTVLDSNKCVSLTNIAMRGARCAAPSRSPSMLVTGSSLHARLICPQGRSPRKYTIRPSDYRAALCLGPGPPHGKRARMSKPTTSRPPRIECQGTAATAMQRRTVSAGWASPQDRSSAAPSPQRYSAIRGV